MSLLNVPPTRYAQKAVRKPATKYKFGIGAVGRRRQMRNTMSSLLLGTPGWSANVTSSPLSPANLWYSWERSSCCNRARHLT
eukprot:CAMPEP_0117516264 /NCGR_PEP_ID=MMETSP0784-20121206/31005_1 /TAXON_ID=39447 /ORGANISM="" /LENGTH=81 /DNA_ID=CAMNT_0005312105 /DNA_START=455 /DNA_END=700 /DNA_ORIENTATION=-